ncbi:MAG: hypothetical protein GY870_12995 [archaeon]|nr:hypothetical protein [archaeon]
MGKKKTYKHHGIQKARGSETEGTLNKDLFLETLWDVMKKEATFIRTQVPRFNKLWQRHLFKINPHPHQIRQFKVKNVYFLATNENKVETIKRLEASLIDGYYTIKSVVSTLFNSYFPDSSFFLEDFKEEDRIPVMYMAAETLIGSLLQFLDTEKGIIDIKFIIAAKNKSILKLKELSDARILEKALSSDLKCDIQKIHEIMDELTEFGYVKRTKLTTKQKEEEKLKGRESQFNYRWNKEFELSPEGKSFYQTNIFQVIEWCVGLWRSLYNIRELDVVISRDYKFKKYLEETVKKAATQGFMTCYWVIKNIRKYYEMLIEDEKKQNA